MVDLNELKKKYTELTKEKVTTNSDDFLKNFMSFEVGSNVVRILPAKEEGKWFYVENKVHKIHDQNGKAKNVHCLKMHGEPCPLCDAYYEMWKRHKLGDTALAEKYGKGQFSIRAKERIYMNVVDRKTDTVKILSVGKDQFKTIMSYMLGDDNLGIEGLGDITSLDKGHDFNFIVTMKGEFRNYEQSRPKMNATPAGSSKLAIAKYMDSLHDIKALIKKENYEEVKALAQTLMSTGSIPSKDDSQPITSEVASEEEFKKRLEA